MNHVELGEQLEQKRGAYQAKWDAFPDKKLANGKVVKDIPAGELAGLRSLMDEINDISVKQDTAQSAYEQSVAIAKGLESGRVPVNRVAVGGGERGLADSFLDSMQWKSRAGSRFGDVELGDKALDFLSVKATMTTSAGFAPQVVRDGIVVPAISRPPQLIDALRKELTEQNSVKFMKQSTRTNAAAPKGEGVSFDEATLVYTEANVDIRKIGVYLPVTEEQLGDEPGVRALVEQDLALMVRQKLDEQVTIGDGLGQNLTGFTSLAGSLTQARGTDEEFDQIMKAMGQVRTTGGARPNLIVLHTNNFQRLALTKTADGIYVFGNPAETPLQRVWGVQVVLSDALPVGTGLVIDSDFSRLKLRSDVTIGSTDTHADYFTKNMVTFRAHVRAGLQVLRDESFCVLSWMRS